MPPPSHSTVVSCGGAVNTGEAVSPTINVTEEVDCENSLMHVRVTLQLSKHELIRPVLNEASVLAA